MKHTMGDLSFKGSTNGPTKMVPPRVLKPVVKKPSLTMVANYVSHEFVTDSEAFNKKFKGVTVEILGFAVGRGEEGFGPYVDLEGDAGSIIHVGLPASLRGQVAALKRGDPIKVTGVLYSTVSYPRFKGTSISSTTVDEIKNVLNDYLEKLNNR